VKREDLLTASPSLWHGAGRAAKDPRKRRIALVGVLWSVPTLLAGSALSHLVRLGPGGVQDGLRHPVDYVLAPLATAYEADDDLAMLGYVALQALLLLLLWGRFGGALYRLAAADLAGGEPETPGAAHAFARQHWRAFVGSRLVLWLGFGAPLLAIVLLALLGRLPGWSGGLLLALVVPVAVACALVAALVGTCWWIAGFLQGPTIACEDSDAFDALSRTFGYAGAGLPRLVRVRAKFAAGVVLGTLWRLARTLLAAALGWACLRIGAGEAAFERALAVLGAMGTPQDGARLGVTGADHVLAFALGAAVSYLLAAWLADLVVRVVCGRTAAYLELRRDIDGVPVDTLATAPATPPYRTAAEAGFEEVGRVGRD
jgi:hypothetical protein